MSDFIERWLKELGKEDEVKDFKDLVYDLGCIMVNNGENTGDMVLTKEYFETRKQNIRNMFKNAENDNQKLKKLRNEKKDEMFLLWKITDSLGEFNDEYLNHLSKIKFSDNI